MFHKRCISGSHPEFQRMMKITSPLYDICFFESCTPYDLPLVKDTGHTVNCTKFMLLKRCAGQSLRFKSGVFQVITPHFREWCRYCLYQTYVLVKPGSQGACTATQASDYRGMIGKRKFDLKFQILTSTYHRIDDNLDYTGTGCTLLWSLSQRVHGPPGSCMQGHDCQM